MEINIYLFSDSVETTFHDEQVRDDDESEGRLQLSDDEQDDEEIDDEEVDADDDDEDDDGMEGEEEAIDDEETQQRYEDDDEDDENEIEAAEVVDSVMTFIDFLSSTQSSYEMLPIVMISVGSFEAKI